MESFVNGNLASALRGRQQIGEAFAALLSTFSTVYHLNGQQTVTVTGDSTRGTAYCLVTLIGTQNGQKVTTSGVIYQNEYVRRAGHWLIAKRTSTFSWHETRAE